jgi:hypothetical protein
LIDCVGASRHPLQTAPSLVGFDVEHLTPAQQDQIEGDLFAELGVKIGVLSDTPASWIKNVKIVDLFAKSNRLDLHDVLWFRRPDGCMTLHLPGQKWLRLTAPDLLGKCKLETYAGWESAPMPQQAALDLAHKILCERAADSKTVWSRAAALRWGREPVSDKQKAFLSRRPHLAEGLKVADLSRLEASRLICRGIL